MKTLSLIVATALTVSGISSTQGSDDGLTTITRTTGIQAEMLSQLDDLEVVNDVRLEEALDQEGIELLSLDDSQGAVNVEMRSTLGDGTDVVSELSMDFVSLQGVLELDGVGSSDLDSTFLMELHELNDSEISFTLTDLVTGQNETYSSLDGMGAAVPLIVGVPIGLAALEALFKALLLVVIAGLSYLVAAEVIAVLKKSGSSYQHFTAIRHGGKLYLGNGISYTNAISRVRVGQDIWSRTTSGAKTVCTSARANGKQPIGPEIDTNGAGRFQHYHPNPRTGAHCFFGVQR